MLDPKPVKAQITTSMIIIGQQFVEFSFQLRFSVRSDTLTFFVEEEEYEYSLIQED